MVLDGLQYLRPSVELIPARVHVLNSLNTFYSLIDDSYESGCYGNTSNGIACYGITCNAITCNAITFKAITCNGITCHGITCLQLYYVSMIYKRY